ncbi:hypothetical protein BZA77DRAFT_316144 [Pyronema omphalodes]|nr:hypothetical protein BZA77DRAFT_316144 [Pyronema omphalodes]
MDPSTQTSNHPNKQYPSPPTVITSHSHSPYNSPTRPPSYSPPSSLPSSYPHGSPLNHGLGLHIPNHDEKSSAFTTVPLHPSHNYTPSSSISSTSSHSFLKPLSPLTLRTSNELRSLTISRTRFILRLLSTIFSMVIVGMISDAYTSFFATRAQGFLYGGLPLWPDEGIDLTSSNAIFAVGVVTSVFSMMVLVGGLWPRIRHVTMMGDFVHSAVAVGNLGIAVGGTVFARLYHARLLRDGGQTEVLRDWTCARQEVLHPLVQFSVVCGNLRAAEVMGWGVVVVEALVLVNVVLGCVFVKREGTKGHARMASMRSLRGRV